jgi:CRISPR-associated protein Cmr6
VNQFAKALQEAAEKAAQKNSGKDNDLARTIQQGTQQHLTLTHGRYLDPAAKNVESGVLREPPMMYRAQVQGRCNLQFAGDKGDNLDRNQWMKEWKQTQNVQPRYQYRYEEEGDRENAPVHSFKVKFPYRVFSNSGQDSILRPVLGQYGIPFIPGSSLKGLFKHLLNTDGLSDDDRELVRICCGDEEEPGKLRFHGAYPEGDWSNQMVDIVHPQQSRQVGTQDARISGSAFALLSFYQPNFIVEMSSSQAIDWKSVGRLMRTAFSYGLGGKTSLGYGFLKPPQYAQAGSDAYRNARHFSLQGEGVSSLLLNRTSEFRPNLFKASLRGHLQRLFGGVCDSESQVNEAIDYFFGSNKGEGVIRLFYEFDADKNRKVINSQNPKGAPRQPEASSISGVLHIATSSSADLEFIENVLKFAYFMGGFGKSWRRVWHKTFYPSYQRFHIGCHWVSADMPDVIETHEALKQFLDKLHQGCGDRLGVSGDLRFCNWRESFHPGRVAVFCSKRPMTKSLAIELFHDETFKTTTAIGGRSPHRDHPNKFNPPQNTSSVWHRMLPLKNGKEYLEIVTVFYGDRAPWIREGVDQLMPFVKRLEAAGLAMEWGTRPREV